MASIHRDLLVDIDAATTWSALRDVGRAHHLFAGVLADCRLEGDLRLVTFAGGPTLRERILTVDEARRRVVYSVLDEPFTHHAASMQVIAEGADRCRFVWTSDFLPAEAGPAVEPIVDAGCAALKATLEGRRKETTLSASGIADQ